MRFLGLYEIWTYHLCSPPRLQRLHIKFFNPTATENTLSPLLVFRVSGGIRRRQVTSPPLDLPLLHHRTEMRGEPFPVKSPAPVLDFYGLIHVFPSKCVWKSFRFIGLVWLVRLERCFLLYLPTKLAAWSELFFYLILLLIKCINYGWVVSGIFLPPSIIVFKFLNNHLFILYYIWYYLKGKGVI